MLLLNLYYCRCANIAIQLITKSTTKWVSLKTINMTKFGYVVDCEVDVVFVIY